MDIIKEIIEEKQLRELQRIAKADQKELRSLVTELIERINSNNV